MRIVRTLLVATFELHFDCTRLVLRTGCPHSTSTGCPADKYWRQPVTILLPVEKQLNELNLGAVAAQVRKKAPHVQKTIIGIMGHCVRMDSVVEH